MLTLGHMPIDKFLERLDIQRAVFENGVMRAGIDPVT